MVRRKFSPHQSLNFHEGVGNDIFRLKLQNVLAMSGERCLNEEQVATMRWLLKEKYDKVIEGLKHVYNTKLLPMEEKYLFHHFYSPRLTKQDFDSKPMVLFIGQYSSGKTTLIRYILEKDYPGLRIGPEPTTDRFIFISKDLKERVIPGNALVADPNLPFKGLSSFGNLFLNRFQGSTVDSPVLDSISLIDTPGILSGEKHGMERGYDFMRVLEWFAERVSMIIILFDANKLDISDEFQRAIEAVKGHDDKVKIILNKSDSIDHHSLLRVYGALMWSIGKVLNTPEIARVHIGSFWDQPLRYDTYRRLFQEEEQDLFRDMQTLPNNTLLHKLNDLSKRARLAMVHAFIISHLHKKMPIFFGKEKAQSFLIDNLESVFEEVQKKYLLSSGDFPEPQRMKERLRSANFSTFCSLNNKLISKVDEMMSRDITSIMGMIPDEVSSQVSSDIQGGIFTGLSDGRNPFGKNMGEGVNAGQDETEWVVNKFRSKYDQIFDYLKPVGGKLLRTVAKEELMKSKLPSSVLVKIWRMSDVDRDGLLDSDEFALAMYLVELKLGGHELPPSLPLHLLPPSKLNPEAPPVQ